VIGAAVVFSIRSTARAEALAAPEAIRQLLNSNIGAMTPKAMRKRMLS